MMIIMYVMMNANIYNDRMPFPASTTCMGCSIICVVALQKSPLVSRYGQQRCYFLYNKFTETDLPLVDERCVMSHLQR